MVCGNPCAKTATLWTKPALRNRLGTFEVGSLPFRVRFVCYFTLASIEVPVVGGSASTLIADFLRSYSSFIRIRSLHATGAAYWL